MSPATEGAGSPAPRRPGRPPSPSPRSVTVRYRLTAKEHAALTAVAHAAGQTVTDYARNRALADT